MGEIFNVKELAEDCAADWVYEYLFVAPPIPITGAVGSPVNPLAISDAPHCHPRSCARSPPPHAEGVSSTRRGEGLGVGGIRPHMFCNPPTAGTVKTCVTLRSAAYMADGYARASSIVRV
jgi:hypothetical protein